MEGDKVAGCAERDKAALGHLLTFPDPSPNPLLELEMPSVWPDSAWTLQLLALPTRTRMAPLRL